MSQIVPPCLALHPYVSYCLPWLTLSPHVSPCLTSSPHVSRRLPRLTARLRSADEPEAAEASPEPTEGCHLANRFRAVGSTWHPYVPPFGFNKCVTCTCQVRRRAGPPARPGARLSAHVVCVGWLVHPPDHPYTSACMSPARSSHDLIHANPSHLYSAVRLRMRFRPVLSIIYGARRRGRPVKSDRVSAAPPLTARAPLPARRRVPAMATTRCPAPSRPAPSCTAPAASTCPPAPAAASAGPSSRWSPASWPAPTEVSGGK